VPIPLELRACTLADVATLAIIGAATVLETFAGLLPDDALLAHCAKNHSPAAYAAALGQPQTRAWLAEMAPGTSPVGYALLTRPDFPAGLVQADDLELKRIYLFSRFHGGGAGRRMLDQAITGAREQQARRLLLGVHPESRRALAFYRKTGFVQVGVRAFQFGPLVFEDPVLALTL